MTSTHLSTGIRSVDDLLGGGVETDGLTELYGEGGSGKTLLCLQLACRVALAGQWVFYIDTEGVSVDRLESIAQGRLEEALAHLLISTPPDLEGQAKAVETACQLTREGQRPVGLIVLDSATLYYRLSMSGDDEDEGRRSLSVQLADL
ncbi:MAG: AAA family ATPase, partial [Thermoplasmata archaeon]|nr:AAA family ATPase [Thermoplasmata archaeon]